MTRIDWLTSLLLLAMLAGCIAMVPNAIDREMTFNENIRAARCMGEYDNPRPGCEGLEMNRIP